MSETPNLDGQFAPRIGTAFRPDPTREPPAWEALQVWETETYWVVCQVTGKRPYDWEFAQECLGDEEEAGRFASNAKVFIPKSDLDAAGLRSRFDAAFSPEGHECAWWDGWEPENS